MKKSILAVLMILCFIFLCSCTSKSDVVGVWKDVEDEARGKKTYAYFYEDGSCDWYEPGVYDGHLNSSTWEIKGDTLVLNYWDGVTYTYIISNDRITDQQGSVRYEKVTDDTSKDID